MVFLISMKKAPETNVSVPLIYWIKRLTRLNYLSSEKLAFFWTLFQTRQLPFFCLKTVRKPGCIHSRKRRNLYFGKVEGEK